jgi:hypothetical protein
MESAQKRLQTEEEGAVEPPPDVNFVVSAQGGDGTVHVLTENLGKEHTVGDVKIALSRNVYRNKEALCGE